MTELCVDEREQQWMDSFHSRYRNILFWGECPSWKPFAYQEKTTFATYYLLHISRCCELRQSKKPLLVPSSGYIVHDGPAGQSIIRQSKETWHDGGRDNHLWTCSRISGQARWMGTDKHTKTGTKAIPNLGMRMFSPDAGFDMFILWRLWICPIASASADIALVSQFLKLVRERCYSL